LRALRSNPRPVAPGEVNRYDVEMWPVGHIFRPGHRLMLRIHTPPAIDGTNPHAQGTVLDADLLRRVRSSGENPQTYLRVNNSYPFFEKFDGLIKTGPTHTNVMDLRVALVHRQTDQAN
jgi:predicted acyl esterase